MLASRAALARIASASTQPAGSGPSGVVTVNRAVIHANKSTSTIMAVKNLRDVLVSLRAMHTSRSTHRLEAEPKTYSDPAEATDPAREEKEKAVASGAKTEVLIDAPEAKPTLQFKVVDFPHVDGKQPRSVEDTNERLRRIVDERRWDDAVFFYMDILLRVLPVNEETINIMLDVSEIIGRPSESISIFFEPRTSYIKRTPRMYGKLMRAHQLRGNIDKMHAVFREMVETGIPRAIECYNALLYENQAENNLQATYETEAMIAKEGLTKDSVTYDRLLAIYYKNQKTDDVNRLLDEIVATKAKVGSLGLSLLAQRALLTDNMDEAKRLREQIRVQREVPHRVYFDALIEYYIRHKMVPRAARTLRDMKDYGQVPSSDSMRYLVKYHAEREESERAFQYVTELKLAKQKPDVDIYTTILDMLHRSKSVHDYRANLTEMMDAGIKPLRRSWTAYLEMMTALVDDVEEIESAYQWVKQIGNTLEVKEMKDLVRGYCRIGRPDMAIYYRDREMADAKVPFDASDYAVLIASAAKHSSTEQTLALISEMEEKGFEMDVDTFLVAVNCRAKLLQHQEARQLWKRLQKKLPQFRLTSSLATNLMNAFATLGDGTSIEEVYETMKKHFPRSVSLEMHDTYLCQISFSHPLETVLKAYEEMRKPVVEGVLPTDPSNKIMLFMMKMAHRQGAAGLPLAIKFLGDALNSKNSSPMYARVATLFLLHVLEFGNAELFEETADLLKRINGLGFAYLNQQLHNTLKKSLETTFTPEKVAPKRQLPRNLSMLYNFTALQQGLM